MVIGLFLSYFVYDCMSLLIRQSVGIATGFVLDGGWFVTNMIGVVVLVNIFVMLHVTAALMSFRMVTLLPHHLPRLIGIAPANRVDGEAFYQQAAWGDGQRIASGTRSALGGAVQAISQDAKSRSQQSLPRGPAGYIEGPQGQGSEGSMDSTLRATTDNNGGGNDV